MKRTLAALLALACLFALTAEIRAGSSSEIDDVDTADADSTLDVIAWFGSRDTVTYTIRTSIWTHILARMAIPITLSAT